jgi:hypothetical protein
MGKRILQYLWLGVLVHAIPVASSVGAKVNSEEKLLTPLEASGFAELSSHGDMMVYLEKVDRLSDRIALEVIGKSVEGRDIPLAMMTEDKRFGSRRLEKPIVYIFAQQHGNEPSGKEAALILIRELAVGSLQDLLEHIDVLIVPMANPDGGEKGQRRNANDMDLNRNHAILSEPEVYAVHRLFLEWMPEVTLDVHEYNAISRQWISHGFIKDAEEMLDRVSNLNIAPSIRNFSNDIFIPEVGRIIKEDGFTFYRYIVGAPFEGQRVRHSTTDINDGRQSLGIYNTLSFIFEGKRYGDLINKIERRTKGQVSALTAFLRTVVRYRKNILSIVHSARNEILDADSRNNCYIQMDYYPDPDRPKLKLPVFDLYSWRHTEKELERYEPIVRIKKSIEKPHAYIFSQKETKLVDLFSKHRIEMFQLNTDTDLEVETYTILHVTSCMEEDKATEYVDVRTKVMGKKMEVGDVVVFLNQGASNLITLLLEPQSSYSICTERSGSEYRFSEYLEEGKEYPIFRLTSPIPLDVEKLEINE